MIVAGSKFNMQLLWVLLLSCFFSGILMFAYGNYALITGETALFGFKKHFKFGKDLAIANYYWYYVWAMEFTNGNFRDFIQYYF